MRNRSSFSIVASLAILALTASTLPSAAEWVRGPAAADPQASIGLNGSAPSTKLRAVKSIDTTGKSPVQLLLADGSTFIIAPGSKFVINQFNYNSQTHTGELVATLSQGVMRFVGGSLSKVANGVTINTPLGTLAVHDSIVNASVTGNQGVFSFIHGGDITLTSGGNAYRAFEPGYKIVVTGNVPTVVKTKPADDKFFLAALSNKLTNQLRTNWGQRSHNTSKSQRDAPSPSLPITPTPPASSPPPQVSSSSPPPPVTPTHPSPPTTSSPPPQVSSSSPPPPVTPTPPASSPPPASPSPVPVTPASYTGFASGLVEHSDGSISDAVLNSSSSSVNVKLNPATNALTGNISAQARLSTQTTASAPASTIGINLSGAEYSWMPFASASDLDYLKSQGVTLIRLPISWERMQPKLNGSLDPTYLNGLETLLSEAGARGMQVIVDLHAYGRYNVNYASMAAANNGIVAQNNAIPSQNAAVIGSATLPTSDFANFWGQLANAIKGNPGLAYYDIMNEPYNMGGSNVWPTAAQAAVNAIRATDTNTKILVEGTQWASAKWWPSDNGNLHINDPANKLLYEAHLYFDANGSGSYTTYAQQGATPNIGADRLQPFLNWLKANNAQGFIGEFGAPTNDPQWTTVVKNFMNTLQANGMSGTYWNYTYPDPSGKNSWWPVADSMSVIRSGAGQGQVLQGQSLVSAISSHDAATGQTTASSVVTLTGTPTTTLAGGFCTQCAFIKWGNWSTPPNSTGSNPSQSAVHSGWWVGGNIALNSELPMSGKATYAGNAMGDVFNNLSGTPQNYVATGGMSMNWDFASRSGNLAISGFDKSVTPAGLSFGGPMTAPGQLASAPNGFSGALSGTGVAGVLTGQANGAFVKGNTDPAANVIGNFNVGNQRYMAAGIFAGAR